MQERNVSKKVTDNNSVGLLTMQARGQDGWILAKFFFACLWTEPQSRFMNTQKKNSANIQPS